MFVITSITKPLENGYVQVDANYKTGGQRYFKVPKKNAKIFASDFAGQERNLNLLSNITFFSSIFTGIFGAHYFVRKMNSKLTQFLIETVTAIGLSLVSAFGFNIYAKGEEDKLLKKNSAKEIFYRV